MSAVLEEIIEKMALLSENEQEKLFKAVEEQKRIKAEAERHAFIRSLRGKYKDGLSSVDEFIARKQKAQSLKTEKGGSEIADSVILKRVKV